MKKLLLHKVLFFGKLLLHKALFFGKLFFCFFMAILLIFMLGEIFAPIPEHWSPEKLVNEIKNKTCDDSEIPEDVKNNIELYQIYFNNKSQIERYYYIATYKNKGNLIGYTLFKNKKCVFTYSGGDNWNK